MAGRYNFTIDQGATFRRQFKWENPDGTPVNIDGATATMKLRRSDRTLIADFTPYLTVDGPTGTVQLEVPYALTAALDFDSGKWDLKVTRFGDADRLAQGAVTLDTEESNTEDGDA